MFKKDIIFDAYWQNQVQADFTKINFALIYKKHDPHKINAGGFTVSVWYFL